MFNVITTGKNLNYGKAGQKRKLNDGLLTTALKRGWIENKVTYAGFGGGDIKAKKVELMPMKKLNVERQLTAISKGLERQLAVTTAYKDKTDYLLKQLKEKKWV